MLMLHALSVSFMTGVIWIIQVIHYPLMRYVSPEKFIEFHQFHSVWITPIVGPMMLIQLGSAFFLEDRKWIYVGLSLAVFAATFLVSVPLHNRLSTGFDEAIVEKLIRTNWIRTILWTVHSGLILHQFRNLLPKLA